MYQQLNLFPLPRTCFLYPLVFYSLLLEFLCPKSCLLVLGHMRFHHAPADHVRIRQALQDRIAIQRCRLQTSAAQSSSSDSAGSCPQGWNVKNSSIHCCHSNTSNTASPSNSNLRHCCAHGLCQSSSSHQVNSLYTCPSSNSPATSANQGFAFCCSAQCCTQPTVDERRSPSWLIIVLMSVIGLLLSVTAVTLYLCWRHFHPVEKLPRDQPAISPSKKLSTRIRMDPPPLRMSDTDLAMSDIEYPNHRQGRVVARDSKPLANVKFYGDDAPMRLDSSRLVVSTHQDESEQVPVSNDVTGMQVDVPFVSRTRVQPSASMQHIIPR